MERAEKRAVIICSGAKSPGALSDLKNLSDTMFIAADKGAEYAFEAGITPSAIIGDLDSISPHYLAQAQSAGVEIVRYSPDKDATDLELSLDYALKHSCTEAILTCALGNRIDYSLGNLLALTQSRFSSMKCAVLEDRGRCTLMRGYQNLSVRGTVGDIASIVPLTDTVTGVDITGVRWELKENTLFFGSTRSLSNIFVQDEISISIKTGTCLVVHIEKEYA